MTPDSAQSRYADLRRVDAGFDLIFILDDSVALGSERRKKELLKRAVGILKRARPSWIRREGQEITARFSHGYAERLPEFLKQLEHHVEAFRREPIHPRIVDEILNITPVERRRWVKDGRLPISGSGSFRRGKQVILFPLHPVEKIARLAEEPHVIAEWRERDTRTAVR